MMRFLVDNNLSPRLAARLCDAGHDAVHVRDLGMTQADDETIFDAAAAQDRSCTKGKNCTFKKISSVTHTASLL